MVQADDKKKTRINCVHHLFAQMSYSATKHLPVVLPEPVRHQDDVRQPVASDFAILEIY